MHNRYKQLIQKQNPIITGVVHHYWYNTANVNEQYYFIEWLELFFNDGSRIVFHRNEDSGLIEIVEENIAHRAQQIKNDFQGKISIKSLDCSETDWWKEIVNNPNLSFIEDPVIEEIAYPESLLIKTPQVAMLVCPAEEEGINLERFIEE